MLLGCPDADSSSDSDSDDTDAWDQADKASLDHNRHWLLWPHLTFDLDARQTVCNGRHLLTEQSTILRYVSFPVARSSYIAMANEEGLKQDTRRPLDQSATTHGSRSEGCGAGPLTTWAVN